MRIEELHQEFLTYLSVERNCSPLTIQAYKSDGRMFLQSLEEQGVPPEVEAITKQAVRQYVVWLRERGLKPSSVARRINSLRSFWNYLWDNDYTKTNPFRHVTLPRQPRNLPTYLSEDECRRVIKAAGNQQCQFDAIRDKAVLMFMMFTGARRSEVLRLHWSDVDLDQQIVRFSAAKGDRTRVLPLAREVCDVLHEWREVRPESSHRLVFTAKWGARLGRYGLASALRRALESAGIDRPDITPHKLRHSFACMLLSNGADLHCLQEMLGHSRLDTTGIYLHATADSLRAAMRRHPLSSDCG